MTLTEPVSSVLGSLEQTVAFNSFHMFIGQVQQSPEELKIRILQVIFDVFMVHENDFLANGNVGVRDVLSSPLLFLKYHIILYAWLWVCSARYE